MSKVLEKLSATLIYLLPIFIISGNFLADLSVVIINILFITILIRDKSINLIVKNKYFWIIVFFYLYLVIRSIFTLEWISIKSSIFTFRFVIFIFAFYYLYKNKILNLHYLLLILISLLFILFIDGTYQYIFKTNIFGYDLLHPNRVSSLFGDELILGSYTFRVLLLIIPLLFLINKEKIYFKIFLQLIFFSIILIFIIVMSGERLALFLSLIYFLSLPVFLLKTFLYRSIFIFSIFLGIFFIFNYNNNFTQRIYTATKHNLMGFVFQKDANKRNILSLSKMHDHHYATGIEMFKDNIIFGQGPKMFRIKCSEKKFNVGEFSCSTHPHNIIIQFLAELGIVGTLFLIYFYLTLLLNIKKAKKKSSIINQTILVFLIFFPLLPYGNFFHNGLVIMNIFSISLLWCFYYDDNKQH